MVSSVALLEVPWHLWDMDSRSLGCVLLTGSFHGDSLVVWGRLLHKPEVGSILCFLPSSPCLLSAFYKDASHWFGTHTGIPE